MSYLKTSAGFWQSHGDSATGSLFGELRSDVSGLVGAYYEPVGVKPKKIKTVACDRQGHKVSNDVSTDLPDPAPHTFSAGSARNNAADPRHPPSLLAIDTRSGTILLDNDYKIELLSR